MIVDIQGWVFDLNIQQTSAYSNSILQDQCQCGYCRNFYVSVDSAYPQLRGFLSQFGMRVETPEELMPFEPTIYEASYCICGTVLKTGLRPLTCQNIVLSVEIQTDLEPQCSAPFFVLKTGYLEIPWVLQEDMNEVVSPANEPEYLQRMWSRLLQNTPGDTIQS